MSTALELPNVMSDGSKLRSKWTMADIAMMGAAAGALLKEREQTVAVAESSSGG